MKERIEELKELLRSLEAMKVDLMERIVELESRIRSPADSGTVYPPALASKEFINGSPVYQFDYEGALPLYQQDGTYRAAIRHYYFRSTFAAFEALGKTDSFNCAAVFIVHFFKNRQIRDLDNRNRKFLIDALRQTPLIKDDSWQDVSVLEEGHFDPNGDHVRVFVMDRQQLPAFLENRKMGSAPQRKEKNLEQNKEDSIRLHSENNGLWH